MAELSGQIALVTGATRGIGKAIALALAEGGATVIGTATTAEGAANIGRYLKDIENAGKGEGIQLDVTDAAATDAALAAIEARHGVIAILVNNAGITRDNLLLRMKDDDWDAIMATNLKPVFRLAKAVLRGMMKARWGRIVNISSVAGLLGSSGQANYAASKAAIIALTLSTAREMASRNITANAIAPGFIPTELTSTLSEQQRDLILSSTPLGRSGSAEEVAAAISFLCSPEAGYITGQVLCVDGGMAIHI